MLHMDDLVEQYGDALFGLCRKLTQNRHDAEDLYQQTFLAAMGKQFRKDGNPKALLTSICIAQWKNEMRKRARRHRIAPEITADIPLHSAENPEEEAFRRQQQENVRNIVAALDEKFRLPVLLYYSMDLSLSEIAHALHCPEGTVKSRLYAAREKIKQELEVMGYDR